MIRLARRTMLLPLAVVASLAASAAERRLSSLKDGDFFSLDKVPEEIVVERRT